MGRLGQPARADDHVRLRLGLYALGAMAADEHQLVEEHLSRCGPCRIESEELSEVTAYLSLLSEEDIRAIADEFPATSRVAPKAPTRSARGGPPLTTSSPGTAASTQAHRPGPRRATRPGPRPATRPVPSSAQGSGQSVAHGLSHGPASGGPGRGSARRRPASLGMWVRVAVATVVVTLGSAIGIGIWLQSGNTAAAATLAGSATDTVTGAGMSLTVTPRPEGSRVEATVTGVRPGVQYQLIAVTVEGRTDVVARWVASDISQVVQADLPVATYELAFFAVTQMNGSVIVSVRFASAPQTP